MNNSIDYEDISYSEHEWLKYPISRQYQPAIARFIIKNSQMKDNVEYMGSYYIVEQSRYADKFINPRDTDINLDVIYLNINSRFKKPFKNFGKYQAEFSSLLQFAEIRKPPVDKIGVYFFGELHDEHGFIHWNVAFLYPSDKIVFFDSNTNKEYPENEDFFSRRQIVNAFSETYGTDIKLEMFLANKFPQFISESGRLGVDRFCQTWVLLFLDIFCNNFIQEFLTINFEKYQTLVVKAWIISILDRMKEESIIWTDKKLQYFPYCAIVQNRRKYVIKSALDYMGDRRMNSCIEMIIHRFLWQDLGMRRELF
jgi:hypothetical protein